MDENSNMLPEVIIKLTEVLEVIDRHDVPLAGIHVANAITVLNESLGQRSERGKQPAAKRRKGAVFH